MALLDDVKAVCQRLAPRGWARLFAKHGLDITRSDLGIELRKRLRLIDRTVPGFEDFSQEGQRGIEPGSPGRSLLFHGFASANVLQVDGQDLGDFPTLQELETLENYVFGVQPPSLQGLSALAAGAPLAVAVFAVEYRVAADTVHRKHADLCFSRSGVARVGTREPLYDARRRGFAPFVEGDDHALRVLPARYAAYIAVQRSGDPASFGPMRFNFRALNPQVFGDPSPGDDARRLFWVPLHKLFSGRECIQGFNLTVGLEAHHVNEKLRRVHLELIRQGHDTGWRRPDIDGPPFLFTDGIATFSRQAEHGAGLLVPVPHARLVEPATLRGQPLTFRVPANRDSDFAPSMGIAPVRRGARRAPEYVHVRHVPDGQVPGLTQPVKDLNTLPDVVEVSREGGYQAQHYLDFSGDGWVVASCPQLRPELPRFIPAYSMVTAPDFFFTCDQRELMDWWLERAPASLRDFLWETPPLTLSDERMAPNLQLNAPGLDGTSGAGFRPEDDTVSAIVSLPLGRRLVRSRPLVPMADARHACLPDAASGIFAPGWDISHDLTGNTLHLASYGLGSPFPEDAKLCAALSTFWPSVAPDAGRSFSQDFPTVSPLTDEELGQTGNLPWDGVPGPRLVRTGNTQVVEYASFPHVDYVESALANRFTLKLTGKVDTRRYVARVLAMARAYRAVGVTTPEGKRMWNVLSFREVRPDDAELRTAQTQAGTVLGGDLFRFELYRPVPAPQQPRDHRKVHIGMSSRTLLFVGGEPGLLVKAGTGPWRRVDVVV
ncbi:hypothetical protein [Archangium sp.]|uniref:hypothetical protein n=1 Tax=Archangium sp. TaxID=1872627 RepID=UPI00286B8EAD|nr:hypothetical protein [Archangium sp.]